MELIECPDGKIDPDTPESKSIGFTSDLFGGYLWKTEGTIIISVIISKHAGKGNFNKLLDNILNMGFTIKVPTPSNRMIQIMLKKGAIPEIEHDPDWGPVEILRLEPTA